MVDNGLKCPDAQSFHSVFFPVICQNSVSILLTFWFYQEGKLLRFGLTQSLRKWLLLLSSSRVQIWWSLLKDIISHHEGGPNNSFYAAWIKPHKATCCLAIAIFGQLWLNPVWVVRYHPLQQRVKAAVCISYGFLEIKPKVSGFHRHKSVSSGAYQKIEVPITAGISLFYKLFSFHASLNLLCQASAWILMTTWRCSLCLGNFEP